jgi:hypothetical protein
MSNTSRLTAVSLVGVIIGLLAVGVVSGTPVRHIIQTLPAALALALVMQRIPWSAYAALPIFVFWLLIMGAIWLFLFDLARIVTGHFSSAEVAATRRRRVMPLRSSQMFRAQPGAVASGVQCGPSSSLLQSDAWASRPAFSTIALVSRLSDGSDRVTLVTRAEVAADE